MLTCSKQVLIKTHCRLWIQGCKANILARWWPQEEVITLLSSQCIHLKYHKVIWSPRHKIQEQPMECKVELARMALNSILCMIMSENKMLLTCWKNFQGWNSLFSFQLCESVTIRKGCYKYWPTLHLSKIRTITCWLRMLAEKLKIKLLEVQPT